MAINTIWDSEELGIIRFVFDGRWTWAELDDARQASIRLTQESSHPAVCVIIDVRNTSILPDGAIQQMRKSLNVPLPSNSLNFSVIVGANMFIEMFYSVIKRIFQAQMASTYAMASTLEEARTLIERRRQQEAKK